MINWKKPNWPIFGVKCLLRISEKKWHHINSAGILSKFCLLKFSPKLNPIWEKRVWKFKLCSFCPDNWNQHCIPIHEKCIISIFSTKCFSEILPKGLLGKIQWAYIGFHLNDNRFVIKFLIFCCTKKNFIVRFSFIFIYCTIFILFKSKIEKKFSVLILVAQHFYLQKKLFQIFTQSNIFATEFL